MLRGLGELLHRPLVLVDIIAKGDLAVHIVSKQVDVGLLLLVLNKARELE
jgi:hypothetical protein